MLYDILPPLLLLFSFGGIIVLIVRAMIKMRAREVSDEIQAHVLSDVPVHAESLIGPNKGDVRIVKNRLFHIGGMIAKSVAGSARTVGSAAQGVVPATKVFMASRKAAAMAKKEEKMIAPKLEDPAPLMPKARPVMPLGMRGIQIPEVSIREKFEEFTEKGKQGLSFLQQTITSRIPAMKQGMQAVRDQVVSTIPVRKQAALSGTTPVPIIRLIHQEAAQEPKRGIMSQMMQRPKEETVLEKSERMIGENNFDEAEDVLVPYIMKHASDTKAYMLLGAASMGKGSWEEAMEIFQQVLKINNEESQAHAQLGHAALQAGKFTVAIQALQRARDNDPENISIREDLLFIARRMDNKVVVKGLLEELEVLRQKA